MSAAIDHSIYLGLDDAKGESIAHVRLFRRNVTYWITDLWVGPEHRKQSIATRLMNEALALYGDRALYLEVRPYTDQPLAYEVLATWYARFGFAPTEVPDVLRRTPKTDNNFAARLVGTEKTIVVYGLSAGQLDTLQSAIKALESANA